MYNVCAVSQSPFLFCLPFFTSLSLSLSPSFPLSHSFLFSLPLSLPLSSLPPSLPPSLPLSSLQVQLGQEDLETAIRLGISMAESIVPLIKRKSETKTLILKMNYFLKVSGELAGAVVQGLTGESMPHVSIPMFPFLCFCSHVSISMFPFLCFRSGV